jgi:DNA-binding transcriptional ArsR family regulator
MLENAMQADRIVYSMATELDGALSFVGGAFDEAMLSEELRDLKRRVSADWLAQWPEFLGRNRIFFSLLSYAAQWAGVITEADYTRATLAIRELSIEQVLEHIAQRSQRYGITPNPDLPPDQRMIDAEVRMLLSLSQELGFELGADAALVRRSEQELQRVPRILRGGDLHGRFWHWLDQFYYEAYRPWRATREPALQALEQHARAILADVAPDAPPPLDWLPRHNPLRRMPEFANAVRSGRLAVQFLVEPFDMPDALIVSEDTLITSFAEPGAIYANLRRSTVDIAARVQALADPTRLMILRMIRYLSMSNTDIAEFLELARPTVSIHAKVLREAGLIETHSEGRQVRHTIKPGAVRRLFADLEKFLDLPDE